MSTATQTSTTTDPHRRKALEAVEDAFRRQQYQAERDTRDGFVKFATKLREINPSITWDQVMEALNSAGVRIFSTDQLRSLADYISKRA